MTSRTCAYCYVVVTGLRFCSPRLMQKACTVLSVRRTVNTQNFLPLVHSWASWKQQQKRKKTGTDETRLKDFCAVSKMFKNCCQLAELSIPLRQYIWFKSIANVPSIIERVSREKHVYNTECVLLYGRRLFKSKVYHGNDSLSLRKPTFFF